MWISCFDVSQEMNPLRFSNNFIKDLNFFPIPFGRWQGLPWVWHEPSCFIWVTYTSKGQTEGCSKKKNGSTHESPAVVLQEGKLKKWLFSWKSRALGVGAGGTYSLYVYKALKGEIETICRNYSRDKNLLNIRKKKNLTNSAV